MLCTNIMLVKYVPVPSLVIINIRGQEDMFAQISKVCTQISLFINVTSKGTCPVMQAVACSIQLHLS